MVFAGATVDDALVEAQAHAGRTGAVLIHPFDHRDIVAGQGTVGLEILEQCPQVRSIVVATGGGGLVAGVGAAIKGVDPSIRVYGVQAEGAAAYPDSMAAGHPVRLASMATMADGIAIAAPGEIPLAHVQAHVDDMLTVPEEALSRASCSAWSGPRWWSSPQVGPPSPRSWPSRSGSNRPWWRCSPAATSTRSCCSG